MPLGGLRHLRLRLFDGRLGFLGGDVLVLADGCVGFLDGDGLARAFRGDLHLLRGVDRLRGVDALRQWGCILLRGGLHVGACDCIHLWSRLVCHLRPCRGHLLLAELRFLRGFFLLLVAAALHPERDSEN